MLKGALLYLANRRPVYRLVMRHDLLRGLTQRYVAGEDLGDGIVVAETLNTQRLLVSLDHLGESVTNGAEARRAVTDYLDALEALAREQVEGNISLKLTQLGLDVDRATCIDNLRRILEPAQRHEFFVRIDMENSPYTEVTLEIFETLWQQQYRNVGVVLQSYLYRSEADAGRLNALGARVRLVKGAYREPKPVAYQQKSEVDAAFVRIMKLLLDSGHHPAIATHDPAMIEVTKTYARERGIAPNRFEFQMLYGVRRDLQAALVRQGYGMRVYVPFGREWFPYFMRRLGERPANVGFVLKSLFAEG